jgi:hypothetical protein
MTSDPLSIFVFNRPLTGTLAPGPRSTIELTKKDLDHPSCRVCYRPIPTGDLCQKHAERA